MAGLLDQHQQQESNQFSSSSERQFICAIPSDDIKCHFDRLLGCGGFGNVFAGTWFNEEVAIKVFEVNPKGKNSFKNELKQLSFIKHQNIINLYGWCRMVDIKKVGLVMEKGQMSLAKLLHREPEFRYSLKSACSWVFQVAKALKYCHDLKPKPLIHRDLKPDNVLLFEGGKWVKICDFGIATSEKTNQTNNVGTYWYMAPEVFEGIHYDVKCDVFSWSIMFWEILARKKPYYDLPNQFGPKIQLDISLTGVRPRSLINCPTIIWTVIVKSWDIDPKERPDMTRINQEMYRLCRFAGVNKTNATV